jgi:hypothetical protein
MGRENNIEISQFCPVLPVGFSFVSRRSRGERRGEGIGSRFKVEDSRLGKPEVGGQRGKSNSRFKVQDSRFGKTDVGYQRSEVGKTSGFRIGVRNDGKWVSQIAEDAVGRGEAKFKIQGSRFKIGDRCQKPDVGYQRSEIRKTSGFRIGVRNDGKWVSQIAENAGERDRFKIQG